MNWPWQRDATWMEFLRAMFPAKQADTVKRYVHVCNECGAQANRAPCRCCGGTDIRLQMQEEA